MKLSDLIFFNSACFVEGGDLNNYLNVNVLLHKL